VTIKIKRQPLLIFKIFKPSLVPIIVVCIVDYAYAVHHRSWNK
jgi:hypothetical protein